MKNIYVASSWRNARQHFVVERLREAGFEVYDFKKPEPGDTGFHWSEIDPHWKSWTTDEYIANLGHEIAVAGFSKDFTAMQAADACVLVMPCGRSAHLEAGYFVGAGKPLYILQYGSAEPELMYKMATSIHGRLGPLLEELHVGMRRLLDDSVEQSAPNPEYVELIKARTRSNQPKLF